MAGPTATTSDILFGLYDAYFLRAPDLKGYTFWQQGIADGTATVSQMSQSFYMQQYAQNSPPNGLGYAAMSDDAFVKAIYANVLSGSGSDAPAQAEVNYWVNFLKTNTRGDFVSTFITAGLTYDTATITDPAAQLAAQHRQDALWNKIAVGKDWLTTLGADTNVSAAAEADQSLLPFDPAFQAGQKIYSGITYNDSTMTNAEAFIAGVKTNPDPMGAINSATNEQIFGTGSGGATYHLTPNVETATANIFDGALFYNPATGGYQQTLNTGDNLTGTGTTPTLNATLNQSAGDITPILTGIEVFNVTSLDTATTILSQNITGLKTIHSTGSNVLTTFTGLPSAPTNVNLSNTAAGLSVSVANTALAGSTDAVAVALSGVTGGDLTITPASGTNGYETINMTSNGATANVLTSLRGANSEKTLTIAGDTKVTIADSRATTGTTGLQILDTSLTLIDASASKGGVVIGGVGTTGATSTSTANNLFTPGAPLIANTVTIKGGSGADSFAINGGGGAVATTFDQRYNINGGDGLDTLIVGISGSVTASSAAPIMTGIETLRVVGDRGQTNGAAGVYAGNGFGNYNPTFNLNGVTGLTTLRMDGIASTAVVTNSGLLTLNGQTHNAAGLTVNFVGTGAATAQTFNGVNYNSLLGVSGNSDAVTVNINNLDSNGAPVLFGNNLVTVSGGLALTGIENLTINATQFTSGTTVGTTLQFGTINDAALTSFNFTADGGNATAGSVLFGANLPANALGGPAGTVTSALINSGAGVSTFINQATGAVISLSGAGNHVITLNAAGGATLNGQSASGNLTLTGNAGADSITGGTGNDTITGGGGADQMTGGLGTTNQFNYKQGALTFAQEVANTGTVATGVIDVLTDFRTASDTIHFTTPTAFLTPVNGGATYATALVAANAAFAGGGAGFAYEVAAYGAGSAWTAVLFIDTDGAAGGAADGAIQIGTVGQYATAAAAMAAVTATNIV